MNLPIAENNQTVLVFKTNIRKRSEVEKLSSVFNKPEIIKWNIDLDDCDKVLRVVTTRLSYADIIMETSEKGFECVEL